MTTYNATKWVIHEDQMTLNPTTDTSDDRIYPLGLDPIWMLATNKILFLNSYKMKMSIIIGVIHMIFGVVLSIVNHVHFKRPVNILLEFLPQILFLVLLFAYMGFMMFFKWVTYGPKMADVKQSPGCAPSVLIMFINMMLNKEPEKVEKSACDLYMFEGQGMLQKTFVLISLVCIPWMLLSKPIYVMMSRKNKAKLNQHNGDVNQGLELTPEMVEDAKPHGVAAAGGHGHDDEPISEIFIHQAIHTIEYVLSTVSHTASYLRLWALSLAHARKFSS